MIIWCAHAGDARLDHSICPEPCNAMHLRCARCGAALGDCPFERSEQHERLLRLVASVLPGDELEALLIVVMIEQAGRAGRPMTLEAARRARPSPSRPTR